MTDLEPVRHGDFPASAFDSKAAWLERLQALERSRTLARQRDEEDGQVESDPDAIVVPAGVTLTWLDDDATRSEHDRDDNAADHVGDVEMQNLDQRDHMGGLDASDEADDSIVDPTPAPAPGPSKPKPLPTPQVKLPDRSKATRRATEEVPVTLSSSPSKHSEVIQLSSASEIDDDSSDDWGDTRQARATTSSSRKKSTAPLAEAAPKAKAATPVPARLPPPASAAAVHKGKGRGRGKARISLEDATVKAQALRGAKLTEQFATVTDLVEHFAQFSSVQPNAKRALDACRIVFVNTDHWRATTNRSAAATTRNRLDEGLRTNVTVAVKQGATLVPPEQFAAPDPSITSPPYNPQLAEAEQWTTHIVPYVFHNQRQPTYDEILRCLGPDSAGIAPETLGDYVKVVKYDWIAACAEKRAKVQEAMYLLEGDFRASAQTADEAPLTVKQLNIIKKITKQTEQRAKLEKKQEAERKRLGTRAGQGANADSLSERGSDSDEEHADAVSPLGSQDWPLGERPPAGYFDQPLSLDSAASAQPSGADTSPADKRIDHYEGEKVGGGGMPPRPSPSKAFSKPHKPRRLEGLEEEAAFLDRYGKEAVDDLLGEVENGFLRDLIAKDELFILDVNKGDDNETEDERDDDGEPACKKVKLGKSKGYACDDPAAKRAQQEGPNEFIAQVLELMTDLPSSISDNQDFRKRSYRRAATIVRQTQEAIPKDCNYQALVAKDGISDKLARKILEIARTGTHRRIACETTKDKVVRQLTTAYGLGKESAETAYLLGARSVDDLRRSPDKFNLSAATVVGLKYYDDLQERIPRAEVTDLYERIKRLSKKLDPDVQIECMGSYRRGAATSGDIDLLVTREPTGRKGFEKTHAGHVARLWKAMEKAGIAVATLTQPNDWRDLSAKVNGLCRLPDRENARVRRIDILGVPWEEMPAALVYFTGDDYFNRSIRLKARKHGYRLNQRGLYQNVARDRTGTKLTEGTLVPGIRTERDLFKKLCVPWREPTERCP